MSGGERKAGTKSAPPTSEVLISYEPAGPARFVYLISCIFASIFLDNNLPYKLHSPLKNYITYAHQRSSLDLEPAARPSDWDISGAISNLPPRQNESEAT